MTESLGAHDTKVFFFLFLVAWLFVGNVSKISFKAQWDNLCKVLCKYKFFLLLMLTVIVMVMILLWSKWFQVTIASRTLILNFSFPEVRFVFFYTKYHISVGVPWMPCALCAPVCVHVQCVHTHMPWFCENDVALTPFVLCSCTLQNSLFRKLIWKGDEAFGLWCGFSLPHFCH